MNIVTTLNNGAKAVAGIFGGSPVVHLVKTANTRLTGYDKFQRIYDGFSARQAASTSTDQLKRIVYNFSQPVANIGAAFLAGKPLSFSITGKTSSDDQQAADAEAIWKRSGSDGSFLRAALVGGIRGDACLKVLKEDDGTHKLKWLDPSICFPIFDPDDCEKLTMMQVAYRTLQPGGGYRDYMETWQDGQVTFTVDGETTTESYDTEITGGGPPFVWIPNQALLGETFGRSDLQCLIDLIERYDHEAGKQSDIIDYYAKPNIAFIGVAKPTNNTGIKLNNAYYLPEKGDMKFVEWTGTAPAVKEDLERIREAISEISETPQVALGKVSTGLGRISGIALAIMFAPLLAKTNRKRNSFGPGIQRAMWMALRAEGHDLAIEDVEIVWPDPLPADEQDLVTLLTGKLALGVSKEQAQRELGYSQQQIAQNSQETATEAEASMARQQKLFDAGGDPAQ